MKLRYDKEEDILMVKVSDEPIDYAEKVNSVIIHFTKDKKPALFEIMDASEFLADIAPNQLVNLEWARLKLLAQPEISMLTI